MKLLLSHYYIKREHFKQVIAQRERHLKKKNRRPKGDESDFVILVLKKRIKFMDEKGNAKKI